MVGLLSLGLLTRFGKSAAPVRVLSIPCVTVNEVPVAAVKMVDSCQFPRSFCFKEEENEGVRPTIERLKACVRSARQFPYSVCQLSWVRGEAPPLRATSFSVRQVAD